jgi:hypothetical protein
VSDRDKPKRSWKEIDSRRDGARRSDDGKPAGASSAADAKASRAHRAALDALFEKGELGKYAEKLGLGVPGGAPKPAADAPKTPAAPVRDPEADARAERDAERGALRKKVLEGTTRDAVGRAFDRYCKAYGMPKDWELLERGLEHPRDARLAEVLTEVEALLAIEKPRRVRTLDGRLRFIAETHEDHELRARAVAIRARLG